MKDMKNVTNCSGARESRKIFILLYPNKPQKLQYERVRQTKITKNLIDRSPEHQSSMWNRILQKLKLVSELETNH